ncbi:unnamed protein product [Gordionus sp. m RMFG-2023]
MGTGYLGQGSFPKGNKKFYLNDVPCLNSIGGILNYGAEFSNDVNIINRNGAIDSKEYNTKPFIFSQDIKDKEITSDNGNPVNVIKMRKDIGLLSGIAINVGIMIGSGIFVSPTTVLINTGSVGLALIVWGLCGIFSFLGALCYAELGTSFPSSGGEYTYIMSAFGSVPAFLYVWMCLLVLTTAGKAANALTFSQYAIDPILVSCGTPPMITKLVAVCLISFLVYINCRKVKLATRIQKFFTICKLFALLVIIIVGGYELYKGNYKRFSPYNAFQGSNYKPGKIALASYSGLYAYSGWNSLNCVTEEVKNPYKNLPKSLFLSIVIVTLIFVATNMAYMSVLSPYEMINSNVVAMSFIEKSLGYGYSIAISVFVALTIFGSLNGSILVSSRIFFAAARNGHFPQLFSMINVNFLTPTAALFFIGVVTSIFCLSANILTLINYYSFSEAFFSLLTILALIYMRYKNPDLERPFKVNIIVPIVFAVIYLFLLTFPFTTDPMVCAIASTMIISGIPVYFIFKYLSMWPKFSNFNGIITAFFQKILNCAKEDVMIN